MRTVFWGNGTRGLSCLEVLVQAGATVILVVAHPGKGSVGGFARKKGIPCLVPEDPNSQEFLGSLRSFQADVFVLAGYGKILKEAVLKLPRLMAVNLHGGKLPERRGSSPLNWALLAGDKKFTLSIIKLDSGIDTGDILIEKTFPIRPSDTIRELHTLSDREFPKMLLKLMAQIKKRTYTLTKQNKRRVAYYPLRFADDGVIIWDMLTAVEVHDHIRALADPYAATTVFQGKIVKLRGSKLCETDHFGAPGRIYKKKDGQLLVCAKDKCLWITDAVFAGSNRPLHAAAKVYDELITVRKSIVRLMTGRSK